MATIEEITAAVATFAPSKDYEVSFSTAIESGKKNRIQGYFVNWHLLPDVPSKEKAFALIALDHVYHNADLMTLKVTTTTSDKILNKLHGKTDLNPEKSLQNLMEEDTAVRNNAENALAKWTTYFQENGIPEGAYGCR